MKKSLPHLVKQVASLVVLDHLYSEEMVSEEEYAEYSGREISQEQVQISDILSYIQLR